MGSAKDQVFEILSSRTRNLVLKCKGRDCAVPVLATSIIFDGRQLYNLRTRTNSKNSLS